MKKQKMPKDINELAAKIVALFKITHYRFFIVQNYY